MRFFLPIRAAILALVAAGGTPNLSAAPKQIPGAPAKDARATSSPEARPAASAKKQKPASELISKQAKPKVVPRVLDRTNAENSRIFISLGKQRAYLMMGDEIAIDTPISSGKRAGMTPKGNFTILEKDKDHRSNIYGNFVNSRGQVVRSGVSTRVDSAPSGTRFQGAPMQYFMRMTWQGVGMHVGHLPGYPASHGCIRMPADIAPLFYERVKLGTPVVVDD